MRSRSVPGRICSTDLASRSQFALSSRRHHHDLAEKLQAGAEIVALEGGVGVAPQRRGRAGDRAGLGLDLGFELDRRVGEIVALERLLRGRRDANR